MERRQLGNTGQMLSVLGFEGIVVMDESPEDACRYVAKAIERGINYFDVAPGYGNAEERLGPALEPYRDNVFLACKTGKRTAEEAKVDLHNSLERLRTDHLDLYQFHGVTTVDEVKAIFGPGGAMEPVLAAKEQGLIRHIGFSTHAEDAACLMLDRFRFDSVLFAVNITCWTKGNFGPRIVSKALDQGVGMLAIKALAKRPIADGEERKWPKCWYRPIDQPDEAQAALRFTLSKPVTAAICPAHAELLWLACDALEALASSTEAQEKATIEEFDGEPIFASD